MRTLLEPYPHGNFFRALHIMFRISLHGYVVSKSVLLWCIAQLYLKIVSYILVTGRRKLLLKTFIGRHIFFTPLISYCLKSQHSTYCSGKKALLGVAKSLEVTQLRVPRRGRHFGKLDDVIIHIQFWLWPGLVPNEFSFRL